MKGEIVLVPFPYDYFSQLKVRPAVCLTNEIGFYNQIVVAFITSHIPDKPESSDIIILSSEGELNKTGLKVSSAIRLHRFASVPSKTIINYIGNMPLVIMQQINSKLKILFDL
ncbi:type II toxin-antitoxin system PemK/MazF family toxin [Parafilimonas sp.]|uniref:type II toxin-antitoxin system PemK/MazF family toxin n=1 Tax=Parafilimonas sp. TaxID=1969739 RepID=UPI0039E4C7F0